MSLPIVKISNLDKYFGRLHVLKNVSLEVPERQVDATVDIVRKIMVDAPHPAVQLSVPLQVDAKAAKNWDEAH